MHSKTVTAIEIIKELPTDGHSPLLVVGNDYEMYVAKNDKGKIPPLTLINEFLSSFFLNKWGIETPESELINIPKDLLKATNDLSFNHKLHYYDIPCFGSKFVKDSIDVNSLLITKKKKLFNRIINPSDLFHLTLYDTWVENDDRKPTNYNLIFKPKNSKYQIMPIDNAYIFSTMSYKDLDPKYGAAVSANEHLLVSELGYLIKQNIIVNEDFIKKEKEYFYICIDKCKSAYHEFISQIDNIYSLESNLTSKLYDFLFDKERNNKVFEEYVYRLNQ